MFDFEFFPGHLIFDENNIYLILDVESIIL